MQLVFAGAALAFAVPAFATSSVDATAPISLCGGKKSEKSETTKALCTTPPAKPYRNPQRVCTDSKSPSQLVIVWEVGRPTRILAI